MNLNPEPLTPNPSPDYRASTLTRDIENYIDVRDELWVNLANAAVPLTADLGRLAVANDALRQMLELTDGPTTTVLKPLRARLELLRVKVCETFIARCAIEILARHQAESRVAHLAAAASYFIANTSATSAAAA